MLFLETGKLEPVHQIDTDFAANPTQGPYFFALSQPAIRLNGQLNDRVTLYAQVRNDRYGAIEDPSGSDVIDFGGGVKYSRFKVGDETGYRAEAGIGMGWAFR